MDARDVVDMVLEVPVVPSFTRLGYDVRSRLDGWAPTTQYDLHGRVMLITGATSGIGLAAATAVARDGATVVLLGRNPEKTARVADELRATSGNATIDHVVADMADLDAVRAAATAVLTRHDRLDVLVHNAAVLDARRRLAPDGTEQTVACQVVAPFLLTTLLLDRLRASRVARVLTMASGGLYTARLDVAHLEMGEADYRGAEQYARAKRAQVTLNELWAERIPGSDMVFHALHPGWVDTPGLEAALPRFRRVVGPLLRSPQQGADTLVWLAADDGEPVATNGRFWLDRRPRSLHKIGRTRRSDTPGERERLWQWCAERAGIEPDPEGRRGEAGEPSAPQTEAPAS
jgi:NAD(P)-dependent dehydrogenase (short-subunit alcohol dehydrogenase family)